MWILAWNLQNNYNLMELKQKQSDHLMTITRKEVGVSVAWLKSLQDKMQISSDVTIQCWISYILHALMAGEG